MRRFLSLLLICALSLVVVACGKASTKNENEELERNEINKERSIELKDDDTVEVVLEGNPTTGYEWVVASTLDEDFIVLNSSNYVQYDAAEGLVGVGGNYSFNFSLVQEGSTVVEFNYKRSWENEAIEVIKVNFEKDSNGKINANFVVEE